MTITTSYRPRDGQILGSARDSQADEVRTAVARAAAAAPALASASPAFRAHLLTAVAEALEGHADELARLADTETALGLARLTAEVVGMATALRFYGTVAADGGYLDVTIDDATGTAPELVRVKRPLGPVAVFGASNFPFRFGVLGGDTGSALASGCPVVAKAHPAHVLTCLRLAEIATEALADAGAPAGAFGMVVGLQAGIDLVRAPEIKAVGFTGSQRAGLALWQIANERPEVIPVYAEMGTVNPVVLTRAGAQTRLEEVARGFVGSFTLGAGQYCTKPGLLLAPSGVDAAGAVAAALAEAAPSAVMLTQSIAEQISHGLEDLVSAGATIVMRIPGRGIGWSADAAVLSVPIAALTRGSRLLEECFGPVALVAEYADAADLRAALDQLHGSLTGSVFAAGDDPDAARAVGLLARQVGRVTVNDWPTGVAVSWAQHHGGPWPSTSDPAHTSVGAAALDRFLRPVTFQSVPAGALPTGIREAVSRENPWNVPQRVNGVQRNA